MCNKKETVCPLLRNPETYNPDTIDLVGSSVDRDYWLPTIDNLVKRIMGKAKTLHPNYQKAAEKAEICQQKFHKLIEDLQQDPSLLKPLSIRTLLETNEDLLREHGFQDFWASQKHKESAVALANFPDRIGFLDAIDEFDLKWYQVAKGVLAGNVFDWGSAAVTSILESKGDFSFKQALDTIEERPWFRDDLDKWTEKIREKPYNKAIIFVDNSGVDFILGILPFTRELLVLGTRVILCANSQPSLNDVTYPELQLYTCKAAQHCKILRNALVANHLVLAENGQKGPCLDLKNLPSELCQLLNSVDLIVLEGMARAVQTNLNAKFTVDSLKVAVLKNEWLAKSMGAKQFSVIYSFEAVVS